MAVDAEVWTERPSLEYQYAYDLCAAAAHRAQGPTLVLASTPTHARELTKRLAWRPAWLAPVGGWRPSPTEVSAALGAEVGQVEVVGLGGQLPAARTALWAEPGGNDLDEVLRALDRSLEPGGSLWMIRSGWLARYLPEARAGLAPRSGEKGGLARALRRHGYALEARHGFHGPVSVAWGYAYRACEWLGRGDLADRCLYQGRAEYAVSGWRGGLAPVSLIAAVKR